MNASTLRLISLRLLRELAADNDFEDPSGEAVRLWRDPAVGPKLAGAVHQFNREASINGAREFDSELFWAETNCATLANGDEEARAELESYAPESAPALRLALDEAFDVLCVEG